VGPRPRPVRGCGYQYSTLISRPPSFALFLLPCLKKQLETAEEEDTILHHIALTQYTCQHTILCERRFLPLFICVAAGAQASAGYDAPAWRLRTLRLRGGGEAAVPAGGEEPGRASTLSGVLRQPGVIRLRFAAPVAHAVCYARARTRASSSPPHIFQVALIFPLKNSA
jgi:hypothetical protein